jgi:GNAT superfamily N-acetyltransferase
MEISYINYTTHWEEGWWGRRSWMHNWRRIYGGDRRWTPPDFAFLQHVLAPAAVPHLERLQTQLLYLDAVPRRTHGQPNQFIPALMEEPVAATVAQVDPRRRDGSGYLGMLHCVNDREPLERLLWALQEYLMARGCHQVMGPTGLLPQLGCGVLLDHFDKMPPLYTAYNPPYLPELMDELFERRATYCLYHAPVETGVAPDVTTAGPAQLRLAALEDLAASLHALLAHAVTDPNFPPVDCIEAESWVKWLQPYPAWVWVAEVEQDGEREAAGFMLLQPDVGPALRLARGGRALPWRWWLRWRVQQPVAMGRVVIGCVAPTWRRQGIGTQLWQQALQTAKSQGWSALHAGPVLQGSPGAAFLAAQGAIAQRSYGLYGGEA